MRTGAMYNMRASLVFVRANPTASVVSPKWLLNRADNNTWLFILARKP